PPRRWPAPLPTLPPVPPPWAPRVPARRGATGPVTRTVRPADASVRGAARTAGTFSSAGPDAAKPGAAAGPGVPAAVSATGPGREAAHHQAAAPAAAATTMIKTMSPARLRTVHPSGGGAVRRRVGTVWKTFH